MPTTRFPDISSPPSQPPDDAALPERQPAENPLPDAALPGAALPGDALAADDAAAETVHVPVMAQEVLAALQPRSGMRIVDGTLGGGGHARMLAALVGPQGRVIALDRDAAAVERAAATFGDLPITPYCASYHHAARALADQQWEVVDGFLLDLGLSSDQLNDRQRGFSYTADGPLDLRFDTSRGQSAWQLLAQSTEKEIADVIYQFGEERFSRRIARRIVERRQQRRPVKTAADLADLVRRCVPRSKNHSIDPATRTFQALRIAVNDELQILEQALQAFPAMLSPGGRIAVISFHSLEDRIVKQAFRNDPRLEVLTKKPIRPTDQEVAINPRSRSAKLRVAQRVAE